MAGSLNRSWGRDRLQSALADGPEVFTLENRMDQPAFRIAIKSLGDGTSVAVALPFSNVNRLITQLFTLFYVFGILIILLGAILARILVGSAFAPLKQVERTAAAIADGDFGQRLGYATPKTEVGRLNRSLNRMLNQIDDAFAERARALDQMRRFVGDASHELRTPLVSVRGYAELYRMGALQTGEEVSQAMDRIEREAIRLGSLVADLLALARLDQAKQGEHTPVELLPLAHDAALDARALAPKRTIRVLNHPYGEEQQAIEVLPAVQVPTKAKREKIKRDTPDTPQPLVQQVVPDYSDVAVALAGRGSTAAGAS